VTNAGLTLANEPSPLQFGQAARGYKPIAAHEGPQFCVCGSIASSQGFENRPLLRTQPAGLPEAFSGLLARLWIVPMAQGHGSVLHRIRR